MKKLKQILNMLAYIMNPFVFRLELLSDNVRKRVELKYYNLFKELCTAYNIKFCDTADFVGVHIATAGFYKHSVYVEAHQFRTHLRSIHINPDTKTLYVLCHELGHFFTLEEWYSKADLKKATTQDELSLLAKQITKDNPDEKEKVADAYIAQLFKSYVTPMDAFVLRIFLDAYADTTLHTIYGRFWFFRAFKQNVKWVWDFAGGIIK
jgi:hypothetical protein